MANVYIRDKANKNKNTNYLRIIKNLKCTFYN